MAATDRPSFSRGGKEAKKRQEENKPAGFKKINWFSIEKDQSIIVRFLHDHDGDNAWVNVKMHSYVPTRGPAADASDEQKKKYPKQFGAVCRRDDAFAAVYEDCFICDHMTKPDGKKYWPQTKSWAVGVEREEVRGTQEHVDAGQIDPGEIGEVVSYQDRLYQEDETDTDGKPTGKKVQARRYIVFNNAWKNFFARLQGYGVVYKTIQDRDYMITRTADGLDTDYDIVPLPEVPGYDIRTDPEVDDKGEPTGRTWLEAYLADPGMPDVFKLIEESASDDTFDWFFDTRHPHPKRGGDKKDDKATSTGQPTAPPPGAPVDQQRKPEDDASAAEKLRQLQSRVKRDNQPAAVNGDGASDGAEAAAPARKPGLRKIG